MNKDRRKEIDALVEQLIPLQNKWEEIRSACDDLKSQVETIRDAEQEYYENMPENVQGGEKGEAAAEAVSRLDEAITALEVVDGWDDSVQEAITALGDAKGEG